MLPFLQPKKMSAMIMAKIPKVGEPAEVVGDEGEPNHALQAASEDLIRALHAKDAMAVARALEAAIGCCGDYDDDQGITE